MPSRRRFLAAAAGLSGAASVAGCPGLDDPAGTESGYLQVKGVSVTWRDGGRRREDEVLFATGDGESELRCRIAEEYAAIVDSAADIRIDREVERQIERDFAEVSYVLGFCWAGADGHTCRNSRASRDAFNRVQFGDRAEVVFDSPTVEVVEVHGGAQGDPDRWDVDVTTFEFEARRQERSGPT